MASSPGGPLERLPAALRLLVLAAGLLAAVGFLGHPLGWTLLTPTLGPTGYALLAHPESEQSRLRSAVLGHLAAICCGLGCLAAFGLWSHPSIVETGRDTATQIGAQALAVGLTLLLLTLLEVPHPPAAATALLITAGIARPGPRLYGMLVGLALVIVCSALLSRVPVPVFRARREGRRVHHEGAGARRSRP